MLFELSLKRSELNERIESPSRVIELHDIPISVSELPSLRQSTKLTGLPWGIITKFIYEYLGQLPKEKEATLSEILLYCLNRVDWQDFSDETIRRFRRSVRKRLNGMVENGSITKTVLGEKIKKLSNNKISPLIEIQGAAYITIENE